MITASIHEPLRIASIQLGQVTFLLSLGHSLKIISEIPSNKHVVRVFLSLQIRDSSSAHEHTCKQQNMNETCGAPILVSVPH